MQTVTTGASEYLSGWSGTPETIEAIQGAMLKKGRYWLKKSGLPTRSDDLAILAYICRDGMARLTPYERQECDFEVAGEVLDGYVTDHDAELLCELVPLAPETEVGGMTREVTAVHTALLELVGAIRETWEESD
jgi:hypothetical protein